MTLIKLIFYFFVSYLKISLVLNNRGINLHKHCVLDPMSDILICLCSLPFGVIRRILMIHRPGGWRYVSLASNDNGPAWQSLFWWCVCSNYSFPSGLSLQTTKGTRLHLAQVCIACVFHSISSTFIHVGFLISLHVLMMVVNLIIPGVFSHTPLIPIISMNYYVTFDRTAGRCP